MFTWICPRCGREVPPSYAECPACAEQQQAGQPQPAAPPPPYAPPPQPPQYAPQQPPQQPQYAPPPQPPQYAPPPQPPQYAPPPQQQVYMVGEPPKKGMPVWLALLLTVAVLGGGLFALYKYVGGRNGAVSTAATGPQAAVAGGKAHPYQKYLEVVGVRLIEDNAKKPVVKYAVVNHSPAQLAGLELRLTLLPTTGGDAITTVDAKVGSVGPYEVKDMESPLATKLKVYELPDWQFIKTTFEITSPK